MLISLRIMHYSIADNVVKPFIIPVYIYKSDNAILKF